MPLAAESYMHKCCNQAFVLSQPTTNSLTVSNESLLPIFLSNGARTHFPKVKWPEHEVDCSLHRSVKIKDLWSYTSIPPYDSMVWCSINHRDNFTFTHGLRQGKMRFQVLTMASMNMTVFWDVVSYSLSTG
jgi:hypothetical protein